MTKAAAVVSITVVINCNCKTSFRVVLADDRDFAQCPSCGDIAYVSVEVVEHWTDWSERPHSDMIAVGKFEPVSEDPNPDAPT